MTSTVSRMQRWWPSIIFYPLTFDVGIPWGQYRRFHHSHTITHSHRSHTSILKKARRTINKKRFPKIGGECIFKKRRNENAISLSLSP
mmetsp:Transcript_29253/g.53498  ORF Transcript_29253/g.53498 Transcript_29253/m.53498 type:complete len:88 (-) Transcript_29253:86-349(-)